MRLTTSLAVSLMLLMSVPAVSQNKTINIGTANLSIRYDNPTRKFIISGITCGIGTEPAGADPQVNMLIETGDGNYVRANATYDDLQNGPTLIPYIYRSMGTYITRATLVKTYDKGGPRVRQIPTTVRPSYVNPNAPSPINTDQYITTLIFPGEVVPGDTMIGIITLNPNYNQESTHIFTMTMDSLLSINNIKYRGNNLPFTQETPQHYRAVTFTTNNIPQNVLSHVFFDIIPSRSISDLPIGERLPFFLNQVPGITDLSIASSHDPNSLKLLADCSYYIQNNSALLFELDIENTGWADENDILVGLRFGEGEFNPNSCEIVSVQFPGDTTTATVVTKWQNLALCRSMGSDLVIKFSKEKLEGVNQLPSGDPKTRARVRFAIKLAEPTRKPIGIRAVIRFGHSVQQFTPTNRVSFTMPKFLELCRYRKEFCSEPPLPHCPICKDTAFKTAWPCRYSKK